MWSPVEKTALAEAEIEYHDHTSHDDLGALPGAVGAGAGSGRRIGGDLDHHALDHAGQPRDRRRCRLRLRAGACRQRRSRLAGARRREAAGGARPCCRRFCKDTGIATHHVARVLKGAELAGTVTAHPLRGRGYDYDVPVLLGDHVTTEAGTGFVHIAPGHGEEDFDLGQAQRSGDPRHGRRRRHVQRLGAAVRRRARLQGGRSGLRRADRGRRAAGARQAGAFLSAFLALQGAADLPRHTATGSSASTARSASARRRWRDRDDRISCPSRDAIASLRWSPSRPSWCISRQRAWGVPIAVFVDRRTGEPLRDEAVVARIVEAFRAEGADSWYSSPPSRFLGNDRDPDGLRAGDGHRRCLVRVGLDPCVHAGGAQPALAGRSVSRRLRPASRLVPVLAAGSRSAPAASRRSRRCSPTASSWTSRDARCRSPWATSLHRRRSPTSTASISCDSG